MHDETATPLIELTGVHKRFGADPPVDALVDVNLRVERGDWISIIGPSGSGKSTLLNIIGCLDVASSGSYRFNGVEVNELDERHRAGLRSRGIGFVFQSFHLLSHRSVIENVMLAEAYRGEPPAGRRARARNALSRVGLDHRADFLPTRLSGGERQRAAIARALNGSPQLLLCDEPTGNLDSATTANVLRLFSELNKDGMSVLMITHEHDVAARARRGVRIVDGVVTEQS